MIAPPFERSRKDLRRAWLVASLALVASTAVLAGQDVRVAITPDSAIRVGDVVGVAVQIDLPASATLTMPDTLDLGTDLENAARKLMRVDSLASGSLRYLITYPITAWRPGTHQLAPITATFSTQGVPQSVEVPLPELTVLSVLPADTTNIEARPPRDVWGNS